jgi:hypothetical protein
MNADQIIATVQRERSTLAPCVLCGRPTYSVGIWEPSPSDAVIIGQPPGKTRVICYHLCSAHPQTVATFERVERTIIRQALDGAIPIAAEASKAAYS